MKLGILSDVHGNLVALERVLEHGQDVDTWVSLGDNIGYMPWPDDCMDLVWEKTVARVAGNHEDYVWGFAEHFYLDKPKPDFQDVYERALMPCEWTAKVLNQNNLFRLHHLVHSSYKLTSRDIQGVALSSSYSHSQPADPHDMSRYVDADDRAVSKADCWCLRNSKIGTRFNFVGHRHIPQIHTRLNNNVRRIKVHGNYKVDLSDAHQALIAVPGVGQPRDGDVRTGYAVFDTDALTIEIRRMMYDIEKVENKCKVTSNFPQLKALWERLYFGL